MKPLKVTTTWTNPITDNVLEITGHVCPQRHATREDPAEEAYAEIRTIKGPFGLVDAGMYTNEQTESMEAALIEAAAQTEQYEED